MIYTVTLNPSIDYVIKVPQFTSGIVNRMEQETKYPGGKGINVSRILQRLGTKNIALGFIGGFTGEFVNHSLQAEAIETRFVDVQQDTRINVKVKSDVETEINGAGPELTADHVQQLKETLSVIKKGDIVVFAGSAPKSLGNPIYNELIAYVKELEADVVCDFEGETLMDSLQFSPLLIKPNNHELEAIFNTSINSLDEIAQYGQLLLDKGAVNVLISMAGDGALLVNTTGTYFAKPLKGNVKNSVGAGDSMVAGFINAYSQTQDALDALKWGVACGSATAFSDDLATTKYIQTLYQQVEVEQL